MLYHCFGEENSVISFKCFLELLHTNVIHHSYFVNIIKEPSGSLWGGISSQDF